MASSSDVPHRCHAVRRKCHDVVRTRVERKGLTRINWHSQRDSNPCRHLERVVS